MNHELIAASTLGTYSGLATTVFAITNAFRSAFGWDARRLGLVVSLVVCLTATLALRDGTTAVGLDVMVGVGNACLVYLTAMGGNAAVESGIPKKRAPKKVQENTNAAANVRLPRPGGTALPEELNPQPSQNERQMAGEEEGFLASLRFFFRAW